MYRVETTKRFDKDFARLPRGVQERFIERGKLLICDPHHSLLHDHALAGVWVGHRSINITGDYRAIYRHQLTKRVYQFVAIGTHHDLYGS